MISRASSLSLRIASRVSLSSSSSSSLYQPIRFASAKAIRSRMEAVTTISKITGAMKTVASARVKVYEKQLHIARAFSKGLYDLWGPDVKILEGEEAANTPEVAATPTAATDGEAGRPVVPNSVLVIGMTPDRGLCGSVSASTNRTARVRIYDLIRQKKHVMVMPVGEKARSTFEKLFVNEFAVSISDHSKLKQRTFKQSLMIADNVLQQPFEQAEIFYPKFKNMVTFDKEHIRLPSMATATHDNKLFEPYELEGNADTLENLYDFTVAVKMHTYLVETDMVEVSQRVNAMGNSSKAATDMLARLKLVYNRTRQNKITTELCEIISGAVSLDEA